MAHIRQSRPDSGFDFQVQVLKSVGRGTDHACTAVNGRGGSDRLAGRMKR